MMAEFNRRKFLIAGAGAGAAGLLSGVVAVTLPDMLDAGRDRPLPQGSGILVIVTLYGGNDGINTIIPYTDAAYHDARPELAYAPQEVLPLDGQLGLNPALVGLAGLWKDNRLGPLARRRTRRSVGGCQHRCGAATRVDRREAGGRSTFRQYSGCFRGRYDDVGGVER
jgi:uncharacterized protein (DUF1501 family)